MKHLLFALLFITASASGQTANYTQDRDLGTGYANRTYTFAIGGDTLDASVTPDTLSIEFDQGFYGRVNVSTITALDSLVVDGTDILTGYVNIDASNGCATCPWFNIGSYALPDYFLLGDYDFGGYMGAAGESNVLEYTHLRIVYIAETGRSGVRTWVTIKQL